MPVAFAEEQTATSDEFEIVVNINTATLEELDKLLIGIGPDKAQAIIDYRNEHGAFLSADELQKVKGIGKSTVAKNAERILVE
nr:ComEA family DNA-binding protein [Thaumasiovibrio subtropicus]